MTLTVGCSMQTEQTEDCLPQIPQTEDCSMQTEQTEDQMTQNQESVVSERPDVSGISDGEVANLRMPCNESYSEQRKAATFLLTFQEKYRVSQTALNFAVGSISGIVESVSNGLQMCLEECLPCAKDTIKACCSKREDPFANLQTKYKQSKFYQKHFGLIVSC